MAEQELHKLEEEDRLKRDRAANEAVVEDAMAAAEKAAEAAAAAGDGGA